ncbi:Uncharacterised protein [Citrobacter werkmanii]|nr:Uncharacterised protein [Citrobacter werkmanii]CAC9259476.1 Uncharacterised protein [Citrobacter werkmanii]CAC9323086.1 Uncharacterised protein [Citrobacter werkmanii]CAC9325573.1 Uncharacterised protein [Citrobacter werkmanii]CAC9331749.1 Uncharacterised protein [Citrobacter werkmanii]
MEMGCAVLAIGWLYSFAPNRLGSVSMVYVPQVMSFMKKSIPMPPIPSTSTANIHP